MTFSIAAFPDIHGYFSNVRAMRKELANVDLVLLVGDMTHGRIDSMRQLLEYITPYNQTILTVCGNHDGKHTEAFLSQMGLSIHASHRRIGDLLFLGCGGSLPRFGGYVFREDQFTEILAKAKAGVPEHLPKILVSHQPPYGTKLDRLHSGKQVGSHAVRKFIEDEQPILCFTGHIHEAHGIDHIGKTQIINSGMIEGTNRYSYAEIDDGVVSKLELRQANPHG